MHAQRSFARFRQLLPMTVFTALFLLSACQQDMTSFSADEEQESETYRVFTTIDRRIRDAYTCVPRTALQLGWRARRLADSLQLHRERAMIDRTLSVIYREIDRGDSARLLCSDAMKTAYLLDDREAVAEAHILKAVLYFEDLRSDSALAEYDRALRFMSMSTDSLLFAKLYANRGNVYSGFGEFSRAIDEYLKAAGLFASLGMTGPLATIYDNIAGEHSSLGQQEKAIRYYHRAIDLDLGAGKLLPLATHYANLGVAYKERGDADSARQSYLRSLYIAETLDLPRQRAQNLFNLGNLATHAGDHALAEYMFEQSLAISRKSRLRYGILINRMGLAALRLRQGRHAEAIAFYRAVLPDLEQMGLRREQMDAYHGLGASAEALGNTALALRYMKEAYMLQDSLFNAKAQAQTQEMQLRHSAERQEAENAKLRADLEIHELTIARQRITVFAISLVVLLALTLLLIQFRSRKRRLAAHRLLEEQNHVIEEKSDQLSESNAIKELLLDIITHDLSNPAGTIRNTSQLLKEEDPGNELHDIVYRSSGRLIDIIENARTLSHATVFETIPKEQLLLRDLVKTAREEFERQLADDGIKLETRIEPGMTVHANPVIIEVIKNYLSNAITHARGGRRIIIDAMHHAAGTDIRVIDFGVTIPEKDRKIIFKRSVQRTHVAHRGHGLGLAITERIARAHGGAVWAEANTPTGNRFVLRIPPAS